MNRRNWWMALFAPQVVGQEKPNDGMPDPNKDMIGFLRWAVKTLHVRIEIVEDKVLRKRKPANNECPVCGMMAKPLKAREVGMKNCVSAAPDSTVIRCEPVYQKYEAITRCAHCNVAFWQDAV